MANNIRGVQPLAWGTLVTTGYITETINASDKTDETVISDEGGDAAIQITGYGLKTDVTLEVIPKTSSTPPVAGSVFAYGPATAIKIVVITIDRKKMNKDVEKWTIKGNFFPNITLS